MKTTALVQIDPFDKQVDVQINGLKRAAMLFDEIHYKVSNSWMLNEEARTDPQRYRMNLRGNYVPTREPTTFAYGTNPIHDAHPGVALDIQSWDPRLRNTVHALEAAGVARAITVGDVEGKDPNSRLTELRLKFAEYEFLDLEFRSIDKRLDDHRITFSTVTAVPLKGEPTPRTVHLIDFPPAVTDSFAMTELLYLSHVTDCYPLFLLPRFRSELDYRYRLYERGLEVIEGYSRELATAMKTNAHFGEVAFSVSNSLIDSASISTREIEDLMKFRAELNDARRKFVSEKLSELDEMVTQNVWSPKARADIQGFVRAELSPALIKFDEQSREIWLKMFGRLSSKVAAIATSGGAAAMTAPKIGGLVGSVMPNVGGSTALIVGALGMVGAAAAAVKVIPDNIDEVQKTYFDSRELKKGAIAYVSMLRRL